MAKVTADGLTVAHVKAARALLDWNAQQLANRCSVGVATIRNFESGKRVNEESRQAMIDALEAEGVKLYNGGQPGARLMKEKP